MPGTVDHGAAGARDHPQQRMDLVVDLVAEHRPPDDPYRVPVHEPVQIHWLADPYALVLDDADRLGGHHLPVALHPLCGEERLECAPLPDPHVALGGQQPVADEFAKYAEGHRTAT